MYASPRSQLVSTTVLNSLSILDGFGSLDTKSSDAWSCITVEVTSDWLISAVLDSHSQTIFARNSLDEREVPLLCVRHACSCAITGSTHKLCSRDLISLTLILNCPYLLGKLLTKVIATSDAQFVLDPTQNLQ